MQRNLSVSFVLQERFLKLQQMNALPVQLAGLLLSQDQLIVPSDANQDLMVIRDFRASNAALVRLELTEWNVANVQLEHSQPQVLLIVLNVSVEVSL